MGEWRLIVMEGDVYWNMAVDEAILLAREEEKVPNTLRLYVIKPSAVTIGYFQKVRETVDLEYIRSKSIGLTRRITGGGAVYHDSLGEITYSVVASIDEVSRDIIESYRKICMGIVYALEELGLKAEFKPINDVVINNRKISGSAQTRKKKTLLQHGTLMYNTDIAELARVLRVPREKLLSHGITSIWMRVTTVSRELGYNPGYNRVLEALIQGFTRALNIEPYRDTLSEKEEKYAIDLINKYKSKEWIYRR